MNFLAFFAKNKLPLIIFLISILFSYSYIDFSSNMSVGVGHVYTAKSLAQYQTFSVDNFWGNAGVDVIVVTGTHYLPYAPLNAVLMAIPYFALQVIYFIYTKTIGEINGDLSLILESFAFSLISSLSLLGILLILKRYAEKHLTLTKPQTNLLLIAASFGTLLFIYSLSFFHHMPSAFFTFLAFYLLDTKLKHKYLLAGTLVGLSFLTEFFTVFFCIALFVAELVNLIQYKKTFKQMFFDLVKFAIPVAIAIGAILIYNKFIYEGFFTFGEALYTERNKAEDLDYGGFSENPLYALYGSVFSPLKGLLVYSPFLIFAFFGIKNFFKNNNFQATLAVTYILMFILGYTTWSDCFGATVYGTRYLIGIIPFVCLITAYSFGTIYKHTLIKWIFFLLVAISIIVNTTNALFGIADSKMRMCETHLNTYSPYHRIIQNVVPDEKPFRTSPAITEYYRHKFFPEN